MTTSRAVRSAWKDAESGGSTLRIRLTASRMAAMRAASSALSTTGGGGEHASHELVFDGLEVEVLQHRSGSPGDQA